MPKGLFGRRMVTQPNWLALMLDPYGHNRTPAENPNRNSMGAPGFTQNAYSPPTAAQDIAGSGVPRAPLSSLLTNAEPQPEVNGMGGPLSPARDIIPNAPQGPSQAELEAQAMRQAMARAHAMRGEPVYDPNLDAGWRQDRINLDRARDTNTAAQAELARRSNVPFEDFWRFGGRQSDEWTMDQPAFRLSRLPEEQQQPRRTLFGSARRR